MEDIKPGQSGIILTARCTGPFLTEGKDYITLTSEWPLGGSFITIIDDEGDEHDFTISRLKEFFHIKSMNDNGNNKTVHS